MDVLWTLWMNDSRDFLWSYGSWVNESIGDSRGEKIHDSQNLTVLWLGESRLNQCPASIRPSRFYAPCQPSSENTARQRKRQEEQRTEKHERYESSFSTRFTRLLGRFNRCFSQISFSLETSLSLMPAISLRSLLGLAFHWVDRDEPADQRNKKIEAGSKGYSHSSSPCQRFTFHFKFGSCCMEDDGVHAFFHLMAAKQSFKGSQRSLIRDFLSGSFQTKTEIFVSCHLLYLPEVSIFGRYLRFITVISLRSCGLHLRQESIMLSQGLMLIFVYYILVFSLRSLLMKCPLKRFLMLLMVDIFWSSERHAGF